MILTDIHFASLSQAAETCLKVINLVLRIYTWEMVIKLLASGGYQIEVLYLSPLYSWLIYISLKI